MEPFTFPTMNNLGTQMADVLKQSMEAWWQATLTNHERMQELSRHLSTPFPTQSTGAQDLNQLLEALELMERRQRSLETEMKTIAKSVASIATHLEELSRTMAKPESSAKQACADTKKK